MGDLLERVFFKLPHARKYVGPEIMTCPLPNYSSKQAAPFIRYSFNTYVTMIIPEFLKSIGRSSNQSAFVTLV